MSSLFDDYVSDNKMMDALLVGRNMVNRDPANEEKFTKYMDLLLRLAEQLPAVDDKKQLINRANVTLAFFEENAELSDELIEKLKNYQGRINSLTKELSESEDRNDKAYTENVIKNNTELLKKLTIIKEELEAVDSQDKLDDILNRVAELDADINHEMLTKEQKIYYDQLNKKFTDTISKKMSEIERENDIAYNKKAVDAYDKAFHTFKSDEGKYKNHSQLYSLVSQTLFAFDARKLFNESLIYYNHVYSYIFSKLDDDGKLTLTRYSIECERKLR